MDSSCRGILCFFSKGTFKLNCCIKTCEQLQQKNPKITTCFLQIFLCQSFVPCYFGFLLHVCDVKCSLEFLTGNLGKMHEKIVTQKNPRKILVYTTHAISKSSQKYRVFPTDGLPPYQDGIYKGASLGAPQSGVEPQPGCRLFLEHANNKSEF